jgi:hypothetical protein
MLIYGCTYNADVSFVILNMACDFLVQRVINVFECCETNLVGGRGMDGLKENNV